MTASAEGTAISLYEDKYFLFPNTATILAPADPPQSE